MYTLFLRSVGHISGWFYSIYTLSSKASDQKVFQVLTDRKAYTLESRLAFSGWTSADVEGYRGPTPEIVAQMASHVRHSLKSTYGMSESGTAGPTGGSTRNRTP